MHLSLSLLLIALTCSTAGKQPDMNPARPDIVFTTRHIYKRTDKIGTGASCDVYKALEKESGIVHALKILKDLEWSRSPEIQREVAALTRLSHRNIVAYYGREEEVGTGRGVLVVEYCRGGSLYSFLQEPENVHGLEDRELLVFLDDTCQGLIYLREKGFVHRDIKPGNILRHINQDSRVTYKLSDFGASKRVDDAQGEFHSLAGTEEYLHPAMFEKAFIDRCGRMVFNQSVDIWSLGATIYHACAGSIPFKPFGGVRENRSIMFQMITCKPPRCIAGQQLTSEGAIQWERSLPVTCHLSTSIQKHMTFIISGLLEADQSSQWTLSTLEVEVKRLKRWHRVQLINTSEGSTATIYFSPDISLSSIQEDVAAVTDVPARSQKLFYGERPLEEQLQILGTSPTPHQQSPILNGEALTLVTRDDLDEDNSMTRCLDKCPTPPNRPSLEQDAKYSLRVCVYVHDLVRLARDLVLVKQGQRRVLDALRLQLRLILLKMEKRFKSLKDVLEEKQARLETQCRVEKTRETISHEVNSSIKHRLKNAENIIKKGRHTLRLLLNDFTSLSSDIHSNEDSSFISNTTEESVDRLESYFEECKSIWKSMRRRRQLSPLSEHEQLLHNMQRREIEELCSKSVTEWRRCLQDRNLANVHFQEAKSKYFTTEDSLEEMESRLAETSRVSTKVTELLVQIDAYAGKAWQDIVHQLSQTKAGPVGKEVGSSINTNSSGYSSLEVEMTNTLQSMDRLLADLPEVEILRFEDI